MNPTSTTMTTPTTQKQTYRALEGNTYPVKDALKALGGRWDAGNKVWKVPASRYAEAQKLVASAPGNSRYHETKDCWECGRPFTYRQAEAAGGDWQDSYCGC